MLNNDKEHFLEWLTVLAESFNRKVSHVLLETYWQCLEEYSFAHVKAAIVSTLKNPDRQKWGMPTPADLIVLMQGDTSSEASQAWGQVVTAIRTVGSYDSVVFDKAIIHCVIRDMGGWIYLCQQPEKELSFLQHDFEKRYRAYQGKPLANYPPVLKGLLERDSDRQYFMTTSAPTLIGESEAALNVYRAGRKEVHSVSPSFSETMQPFSPVDKWEEKD
jgi:hypothetical protein